MTEETITDITNTASRTLYECGSGALRTRITTSTNSTNGRTIAAVRPAAVRRDDHGATTRNLRGSTGCGSITREVVTE